MAALLERGPYFLRVIYYICGKVSLVIRNIIFDWSGTLVDDLPAVFSATNYVFAKAGRDQITLEKFRAEFCLPFKLFYDRYVPDIPLPDLETWFHGHFNEIQDSVVPLPYSQEFLELCQQRGIRMFILSTMHTEHFKKQTAANGFEKFFERTYLRVMDKRKKIGELLVENQLAAHETMFIGDMEHDIDTAKHGGVFSCAVLTGYNRLDQLRNAEPDLIVEHLGELRDILTRNNFDLRRRTHGLEVDPLAHPICTVGAAIFNSQGQVLMIRTQKWSNLWGIPGGKIKFSETSVDALRRELKEETDLDVEDIEFVLVQDCIHSKEFYREAHFVLLNYTCRANGNLQVKLNDEAQEFRWVALPDAMKMELNTPTRVLLETISRSAGW